MDRRCLIEKLYLMRLYPKTFSRLLLVVFLLAVLPVAIAMLRASYSIHALAEQSRNAVAQSTRATRVSLQIVEETMRLERLARQFLILSDKSQLQDYVTLRAQFKDSTSEVALIPLDEKQLAQLNHVIETEEALFTRLNETPHTLESKSELANGYAELSAATQKMLALSREISEREVTRLGEQSAHLENSLLQPVWLLISLGALIAISALWIATRPIRALEDSIRQLGSGDLERPIRIGGPTDLHRIGEQLDALRQRLQNLEVQKTRFLRHVSHELKTPLTALREGAALLRDGTAGKLTDMQQQIVEILNTKSIELQHLIEKLLRSQQALDDLSQLQREPVQLDLLIQDAIKAHLLSATALALRFDLSLVPIRIMADRAKLATILDNLLSNAIKHSPTGCIIKLQLTQPHDRIVLDIQDSGAGVAETDRERIFDWFYQGQKRPEQHNGSTSGVSSSGFGLAIARELALAHQGTLELMPSQPEHPGAHFRLTLPLGRLAPLEKPQS